MSAAVSASARAARRRLWLWGAVAIALSAVLAVAFWPRAVEVELATVDRGTVREEVVDEGRTRMHEVYVVAAPVSGRLLRVAVEPGDAVRAGEGVARMTRGATGFLDARIEAEARAALTAATARRAAATAERELAATEATRATTLARDRLLATTTVDAAKTRLRAAQAAEDAAAAEERRARSTLLSAGVGAEAGTATFAVAAPVAGVVLRVAQESEAMVAAGTPLIVIGDPTEVEVVAEFLSQDAVRFAPGARASLENWGGPPVEAVVHRIEPVARTKVSALGIEEQRANVILRFTAPPPAALRAHDFRVDARIVVAEQADALRVPLGALFRRDGGWAVYRERGGRAEVVPVQVGIQDAAHRVVTGGLAAGDRVVLFPSTDLRDGTRVAFNR
ncbi:MAG: efflux RND transporter periplasmic adaptor subunit [Gammaproteobacteria bacterium]|nr:efflux RND transporter periplasmic adaptor subunit [Gammaproteobacteria bacterium]